MLSLLNRLTLSVISSSLSLGVVGATNSTTSLCLYLGFQSIFMQDRVYVDGGMQYTLQEKAGAAPDIIPVFPTNVSYINLNKPWDFNKVDGFDMNNGFFTPINGDPARPALLFGSLLGNDYSWVEYGGMQGGTGTSETTRSEQDSEKFYYKKDPLNPTGDWAGDYRFAPDVTLPSGITNWVYAGALANSPADQKSWWFSGVMGAYGEEVIFRRASAHAPGQFSKYLITADFSDQQNPQFTNVTLGTKVAPRAGASMVFLPVGEKGILVVIGGVSVYDPIWMVGYDARKKYSADDLADQAVASRAFLQTINVYDIAADTWYSQNAAGSVPNQPISVACAVAATAEDGSSHNIYLYGGHSGLTYNSSNAAGSLTNTKFYVLSLPSFQWIEVLDPETKKVTGRSLHQCHRVQPDQMIVIGGHPNGDSQSESSDCALYPGPGPAFFFNLNTCQVQETGWDPTVKTDYRVPDKVVEMIGGGGTGGAKIKEPDAGWDDEDLGKLFTNAAAYKGRVTPTWAYTPDMASTTSLTATGKSSPSPHVGSSGFPSYIPPIVGTLLGLFCLISVVALTLFIMRRHKQKLAFDASGSETEGSTVPHTQTWSWLLGVHGDDKPTQPHVNTRSYSDDLSTSGTGVTAGYTVSSGVNSDAYQECPISPLTDNSYYTTTELEGHGIHELPDNPIPQELAGGHHSNEESNPKVQSEKEGEAIQ